MAFILMAMCSDTVAVSVSIDIRGDAHQGSTSSFSRLQSMGSRRV